MITITAGQRDALYEQIIARLTGIDAVSLAVSGGDFEKAQQLGREFSDDLQLIVDDLGWGESPDTDAIELTTAPSVLRRTLGRHYGSASSRLEIERGRAEKRRTPKKPSAAS